MVAQFLARTTLVCLLCSSFCWCSSHEFAFALYKNIVCSNQNQTKERNIFFSPYSISVAMEVAYEGARGQTAQEIARALYFNVDTKKRRKEHKEFIRLLNESQKPYTLLTANALWIEQSFTLLPSYRSLAQQWYNTRINTVDFLKKSSQAEQKINAWVKEQTQGMIKSIITPHSLNAMTRLVITNAIYFKGTWAEPFDSKQTKEDNFFVNKTMTVKAPFMHATKEYLYTENEVAQIVELEYAGDDISMIMVLPKDKNLDALEQHLTVENFEAWKHELTHQKINLTIPRIKLDTSYSLVENFRKMGIHTAFDPGKSGADFSGIDGKHDLYIALINHKAALEVNEEGTTAAASTAVVMMMKSMMPRPVPEFRADHPFIIIIQEKTTETILFMGRVTNPAI